MDKRKDYKSNLVGTEEGVDLVKEVSLLRAAITEMKSCISESKDFESLKGCINE